MPGGSRTFVARVPGAWPLGPIGTTVTAIPSPAGKPIPGVTAQRMAIDTTVWALPWPQLALLVLLVLAPFAIRLVAHSRRKRIEKLIRLHSKGTPQEA
jgi:hypothetical protein